MSRRASVPSYRLHKQSGQAIVTLSDGLGNRRDVLLGRHNTPESRTEYARVLKEWEASGRTLPKAAATADLTVSELLSAYYDFAEGYYRKNGEPTSQLDRICRAMKPVKTLYGYTLARDFGPLALKAVREWMIAQDWKRGYINSCIGCVKRIFKWAVANETVPPAVHQALQAVAGLSRGRTEAAESVPVRPVDDKHVDAVLPYLSRPVAAMVQVQRRTGMRPGEVCIMRPCDIDRTGQTWLYRPESHKTEHHGAQRVVMIGPRAQAVLRPFLDRDPEMYLFSPRESVAEFRAQQRNNRKTKVQPSQFCRRRRRPRKQPRDHYDRDSYRQAIDRGIGAANRDGACKRCKALPASERCQTCQASAVPHWHPHQLRHAMATEIRREANLDAARAVLGHRSPEVTEIYAELDLSRAAEVMARLG